MLALTRQPGQYIVFEVKGVRVRVGIRRVNAPYVRICIDAPAEVRVLREELLRQGNITNTREHEG